MTFAKIYRFLSVFGIVSLLNGCIEPFPIEPSHPSKSALVVEATITNEEKQQIVLLSRTYNLNESSTNPESGAQLKVVDESQNEFPFLETIPGRYVSTVPFAARTGIGYRLAINTGDGRSYSSETEQLQPGAQIDSMYAIRETNDFGEDGMAIYIDAEGTGNSSRYFRYEYEEAFKIVTPLWVPEDVILLDDNATKLVPRISNPVCYGKRAGTRIVLTTTNGQLQNRVDKFEVKFIAGDDYVIAHRYSILVKQYTQTPNAYAYYTMLRDFSQSENPLSENQPGFLEGNIYSEFDSNENVIGFFDVSAITSSRIFFNYRDFFTDEPLPKYPSACSVVSPKGSSLINAISKEQLVYLEGNNRPQDFVDGGGPYLMVPYNCGNCTKLGSNSVPDFWIEE